ncbi:alpha/beta fold hydrolase [Nocardia sp. NPDC050697]|uniref:alpha/beta fold hydrolase n=1 Tax=Nocardia sp. NPDC050697 TaxID=3155158 RepID=UPI0033C5CE66
MPKIGRFTSENAEREFFRAYDSVAARWPVPSTNHDVETAFGTTRVRRSGEGAGAPIVLLPGIGGNGNVWWRFMTELAAERTVYTPDVIGWAGRSVQTAPIRDTGDVATWLTELLDGLGEQRAHLVGNSLGAWLAGAVAVHRSDRLASLTLLEPSAATFLRPRLSLLAKLLLTGARPTPERLRRFNRWAMPGFELGDDELAVAVAATKYRMALPWDRPFTDGQLAAITAPTLVLFGAETVVNDPEAAAERARAHIPEVEIRIYPGIGHDLLWAGPDEVIPHLLAFAGRHEQARA